MDSAKRPRRGRLLLPQPPRSPTIDIVTQSPLWKARRNAKPVLRRAIGQASCQVQFTGGELGIVLTDDAGMRVLNRTWRRLDKPTNVLSFPADIWPIIRGRPALLGDIVIAYETAQREARAKGKPFAHHLAHLAVHGFLHLLRYDHQAEHEAHAMEELEASILACLGVPNPYS